MSLPDGVAIQAVNEHVEHLARELYCEYEPTKGPYPDFWRRLELWLQNVADEADQKVLFRLLFHMFFVGSKELDNLYRVAFNENILRWLIDQLNLRLDDPDLELKLNNAVARTWFCPITDSMRINAFYHLNHLSGHSLRPDWLSLGYLGDPVKIDAFLAARNIERIVLLEDFVGSGSQIAPAIDFVGKLPSSTPTLLLPLIICPSGATSLDGWQAAFPQLSWSTVLELRPLDFITALPQVGEPILFAELRPLAIRSMPSLLGAQTLEESKIYGPFGFDGTGGLLVLATNCPDNTLPMIHHKSSLWNALFPRASRI